MIRTLVSIVVSLTFAVPTLVVAQTTPAGPPPAQVAAAGTRPTPPLTLRQAEDLALKNHPLVLAAQDETSAAGQDVRAARAAYYPMLNGELTAVGSSNDNARVGAGGLSASRLINRFGQGVVASQLVTDFGRTPNLVASSKLREQASEQNYQATREDVLLDVNNAYFGVLRAQAVLRVAQQTVDARLLLFDQVNTLAQNGLRSQVDVSFADVNVSDARLLLIRAQNDQQEAYAQLARALGSEAPVQYQLAEEELPPGLPADVEALIGQALNQRPDVASLRFASDAAQKFAFAERDLNRPTVAAVAVAGVIPFLSQSGTTVTPDSYGAAAINVNVPVFNGGLFAARYDSAEFRAKEADQKLRDYQDRVARDVRIAWANATTAFQRLDVAAEFLRSATLALDLAQGRYNLGLSSIVELTQSQLNVTRAEIESLSAKYDYQDDQAALQYAIGQIR